MYKSIITAICLSVVSTGAYAQIAKTPVRNEAVQMTRFERLSESEKAAALLKGGVPRDVIYRDGKLEATKLAQFRNLDKIAPELVKTSAFDLTLLSGRGGQAVLNLMEKLTNGGTDAVNAGAQLMANAKAKGSLSNEQRALLVATLELVENTGAKRNPQELIKMFDDLAGADAQTLRTIIIPAARGMDKLIEEGKDAQTAFTESLVEVKLKNNRELTLEQARKEAEKAKGCGFGVI